jgi:hypothetical protein
VFRHQGGDRRANRRSSDGGHQPHFTGDFHAITTANNLLAVDRQPRLLGNEPIDVAALAAGHRHETIARCSVVSSLRRVMASARGWLRHHGRVRKCDLCSPEISTISSNAGNIIRGGAVAASTARCKASSRARGDDGAAQGCADAEPRTTMKAIRYVHGGPFANIAHGCNW